MSQRGAHRRGVFEDYVMSVYPNRPGRNKTSLPKWPNFWPLRHASPILNREHSDPDLPDATVTTTAAMDAVQTLGYIAAQSGKSIKEAITEHLRPWTKERQLDELLKMFDNSYDLDEIVSELVSEAWNYIESHELWTIRYQDLESLKRDLQYDDFVAKRMDHHKAVTSRKRIEGMTIYKTWGYLPQDAFPDSISPPWFGDRLLRSLNQLSKHCSLKEAIPLLEIAIRDRLDDPDVANRSKSIQYLTLNDVTKVLKRVKYGGGELAKQANTRESLTDMGILDAEASLNLTTGPSAEGEGGGGKDKDDEVEAADSVDEEGATDSLDEEGAADSVEEEGATDSLDEEGPADSVEEEEQEDEQIEMKKVPQEGKVKTKAGTTMTKPPTKVLQCGCASICSALLPRIPSASVQLDEEEGLGLLEWSHDLQWANFCKNHLRRLAGGGLDMYTNITKTELLKRLKLVFHYRADLSMVRTKKPRYFRRTSRVPGSIMARLGPYMYTPKKSDTFTFDAKQVFNRFAGCANAWDTFQEDGTINIDGVFSYILEPEIFKLIEEEFDMYLYHLRDEQDGQKRRGWMRHMLYSLVQQLVRQDPVYYALMAASRPDKNTWLICYPYYVKYQVEGESTGFAHLDINVDRFVETGRGKNIIQGSLSLDDENEHGCTLLVFGFHRHIHEWWARVKQRGQDSSGYTTNAKKTYLPVDQQDFGRLVPVPCKRGAVRITMPEILHGSTPKAKNIRRTLFNWPTGIRADHQTLDMEEAETWNQVAQCHQSMEAPMKSTSGEGFRYGRPLFPFPGVTKLSSTSCVGDSLIGVRRWDDIRVEEERNILLGADDESALQLAKEIRERLVRAFFNAFPYVRMNEERAYQDRSYFRNKYRPRPEAERDESSLSSEALSSMSLADDDEDAEDFEEGDSELEVGMEEPLEQ
ncbi:hypothetical protein FGG08_000014 [Glutinoglossum americanum]|uniref:Uncharacterized protein n=1 Tax=Glutinoglossum americanum TaxID=1670608 RepID=A0A9P8L1P1_9PEZI|nr:hypothetical protein FGG08_000014 [Glutinoglossum americanum]